jgi:hypothetical protein
VAAEAVRADGDKAEETSLAKGTTVDLYSIAKDFAAPLATAFAAGAAVGVTYYFNQRQAEVSAAQRDIALDKLNSMPSRRDTKFTPKHGNFFPTCLSFMTSKRSIAAKYGLYGLRSMKRASAEAFLMNLGHRFSSEVQSDDRKWRAVNEALAGNSAALRAYYAEMPSRFEASLQLSQLARD